MNEEQRKTAAIDRAADLARDCKLNDAGVAVHQTLVLDNLSRKVADFIDTECIGEPIVNQSWAKEMLTALRDNILPEPELTPVEKLGKDINAAGWTITNKWLSGTLERLGLDLVEKP